MHGHLIMLARMYGEMNDNDNALKTDERNLQLTFFQKNYLVLSVILCIFAALTTLYFSLTNSHVYEENHDDGRSRLYGYSKC